MAFSDVLSTERDGGTDDRETRYRCVDCMATLDERRDLCPKCGSETFERV